MKKRVFDLPVLIVVIGLIIVVLGGFLVFYERSVKNLSSVPQERKFNEMPFIGLWKVTEIAMYNASSESFGEITKVGNAEVYLEYRNDSRRCVEWVGPECKLYEEFSLEGNIIAKKDSFALYSREKWKMLGDDLLEVIVETPEEIGYSPFIKYKATRISP
ncbi:MAG: hypothetical protein Q8Q31_04960 [Nanoarchaeota archaeon]|nr:hypothetical protein [Nanoarchaeota archaeon]